LLDYKLILSKHNINSKTFVEMEIPEMWFGPELLVCPCLNSKNTPDISSGT